MFRSCYCCQLCLISMRDNPHQIFGFNTLNSLRKKKNNKSYVKGMNEIISMKYSKVKLVEEFTIAAFQYYFFSTFLLFFSLPSLHIRVQANENVAEKTETL